jgi:hypothetical protein
MEPKLKHLEFIQTVITRMNTNSFLIKGWTVTLVSALLALSEKDSDRRFFLISLIAIPVFWILDGFYLSQERQFRDLYNDVASQAPEGVTFRMNTKPYRRAWNGWLASTFSRTLMVFYLLLALLTTFVALLLFGII